MGSSELGPILRQPGPTHYSLEQRRVRTDDGQYCGRRCERLVDLGCPNAGSERRGEPAALGLVALILTVAAVQTVGAAIVPGCFGNRGLSFAAVLKVRIHLPPAESLVRTENGLLREAGLDRRRVEEQTGKRQIVVVACGNHGEVV